MMERGRPSGRCQVHTIVPRFTRTPITEVEFTMPQTRRTHHQRPHNVSVARVTPRATACLLALTLAAASWGQALTSSVRRLVSDPRLSGTRIGVQIIDCADGRSLAAFKETEAFKPASNMKLLTSGAALRVLGDSFSFKTEIVSIGDRLIIRGGGDPALGDPEVLKTMQPPMNAEDLLSVIVEAVRKANITGVDEVVVDDRVFDREYVHPSWPVANLTRPYSAEVSGVSFHANFVRVLLSPRRGTFDGAPPTITLDPAMPFIDIDNRARSGPMGKNTLRIARANDGRRLSFVGELGSSFEDGVSVHAPGEVFGLLLADRLSTRGVTIAKGARLADLAEDLSGGTVVGIVSTPIQEVLRRCNRDSENLYAESLMKRMGHEVTGEPGSWSNGPAVMRMVLSEVLGPEASAMTTVVDGSGLSHDNRVAPSVFARWLKAMATGTNAEIYRQSLAEPGGEGTLEKRFRNANLHNEVHAKSGYITGVRTLSGYVYNRENDHAVAFSILINDANTDVENRVSKDVQERIVQVIDDWLSKQHPGKVKIGG